MKQKKQKSLQSFEIIVKATDKLGLELNNIRGGVAVADVTCHTGKIGNGGDLSCGTGKWSNS